MTDAAITFYSALQDFAGDDVEAIYAIKLPADAVFPCLVYSQIFGGDGINLSGGAGSTYNLRFQIDIYHPSFSLLMDIRRDLLAGFHRYAAEGILDTRIDLDIPYIVDELDIQQSPQLYRHILDVGVTADRSVA